VFKDYGKWKRYIVDIFLPIVNSENGDLLSLPFEGGIMHQPYMTMQIITCIQIEFRKYLSAQRKKMFAKQGNGPASARRRPHPHRVRS